MVSVHHEGECSAPIDVTFGYVDDYRNATEFMWGLAAFEPHGEQVQGLGAVFDATFHATPVKLHSRIEVVEWKHNELIAFRSVTGFSNESTWRFTADGPDRTKVSVVFSYELPGGLAGKALGRVLEPIVALTVRHSDIALRKHVEASWARRSA
jgi:uncharacterized membrane protein